MKTAPGLSLRAKITLALLVTGLVSAVLVGIIARLTFLQQFNRAMFDASFQAFSADVTAYVEQYGSIVARGRTVAFAVPIEELNLNPADQTYLDAMQHAMLYGIAGAGVMALALGFFFSGRLSANIRALAQAIQAMRRGDLRQHVRIAT